MCKTLKVTNRAGLFKFTQQYLMNSILLNYTIAYFMSFLYSEELHYQLILLQLALQSFS